MGLGDFFKRKAAEHYGKVWSNHPMMLWLKAHKAQVGYVFTALWGWSMWQGCPSVWGFEVLDYLHMRCDVISSGLSLVGGLLIGGGILEKDIMAKARQIDIANKVAGVKAESKVDQLVEATKVKDEIKAADIKTDLIEDAKKP